MIENQLLLKLDPKIFPAEAEIDLERLKNLYRADSIQRISNDQIYLLKYSPGNFLLGKTAARKDDLAENVKETLRMDQSDEEFEKLIKHIHLEENFQFSTQPLQVPLDELLSDEESELWGQIEIRLPEAKSLLPGKPLPKKMPIGIAMIDTGVSHQHPALDGIIWKAPQNFSVQIDSEKLEFQKGSFGFNVFACQDKERRGQPEDNHNHGTMVAGIIGAKDIGIARIDEHSFPVKLLAVKAFEADDSTNGAGVADTVTIIKALDFIIEAKKELRNLAEPIDLRIVNMSFGYYKRNHPKFSGILEDHIKKAAGEGILFVAGTGNDGQDLDVTARGQVWDFYPAGIDCDGMIAVAAIDRSGELWKNSNYGTKNVYIAAPGDGIYSTQINNSYDYGSGTSLAAPFVAASAALLLAAESTLGNKEIKERLMKTADKTPQLQLRSEGSLDIYDFIFDS